MYTQLIRTVCICHLRFSVLYRKYIRTAIDPNLLILCERIVLSPYHPPSQSQETAKKEAWQAVFSDVKLDDFKAEDVDQKAADKAVKDMGVNATIDEVCTAGDAGYVITTTDKDGFGGNIQITVGIKKDGTINGVSILSISETAGLGMKATEPSFYNQYVNKQADKFVVSKDGGDGDRSMP